MKLLDKKSLRMLSAWNNFGSKTSNDSKTIPFILEMFHMYQGNSVLFPSQWQPHLCWVTLKTQNQMLVALYSLPEYYKCVCLHLQRAVTSQSFAILSATSSKCFFSKSTQQKCHWIRCDYEMLPRSKHDIQCVLGSTQKL